jgi:hypothetical protein
MTPIQAQSGDVLPAMSISCLFNADNLALDEKPLISLVTLQGNSSQRLLLFGEYDTVSSSGMLRLDNIKVLEPPGTYTIQFVVSCEKSTNDVELVLRVSINNPTRDLGKRNTHCTVRSTLV